MTALLNPDLLQREELKHFFPDKFIVSARMTIQGVSQQVLRTLEEQGIDHSAVRSVIREDFTYPVYKNALYSILYYCYIQIAGAGKTQGVTVGVEEKQAICS